MALRSDSFFHIKQMIYHRIQIDHIHYNSDGYIHKESGSCFVSVLINNLNCPVCVEKSCVYVFCLFSWPVMWTRHYNIL